MHIFRLRKNGPYPDKKRDTNHIFPNKSRLCLGSADRTGSCAGAAVNASVGINNIFTVAHRNCANGTFCFASAASNTFVADCISHCVYPPYMIYEIIIAPFPEKCNSFVVKLLFYYCQLSAIKYHFFRQNRQNDLFFKKICKSSLLLALNVVLLYTVCINEFFYRKDFVNEYRKTIG